MAPRIFSHVRLRPDAQVELAGNAVAHVGKVLRLREGDSIVVFDGEGLEFDARIESISRQAVSLTVESGRNPGTESALRVTLLQGICRKQRMDLLIQKSTELGVASIRPYECERSVVRLDAARARRKIVHWQQIAISACEQSGRVRVPDIAAPAPLQDTLEATAADVRLLLDPRADDGLSAPPASTRDVALLIGPEGGLTDIERRAAHDSGFRPVRLGPRTMRTETAPLAALSVLQYLGGDLS